MIPSYNTLLCDVLRAGGFSQVLGTLPSPATHLAHYVSSSNGSGASCLATGAYAAPTSSISDGSSSTWLVATQAGKLYRLPSRSNHQQQQRQQQQEVQIPQLLGVQEMVLLPGADFVLLVCHSTAPAQAIHGLPPWAHIGGASGGDGNRNTRVPSRAEGMGYSEKGMGNRDSAKGDCIGAAAGEGNAMQHYGSSTSSMGVSAVGVGLGGPARMLVVDVATGQFVAELQPPEVCSWGWRSATTATAAAALGAGTATAAAGYAVAGIDAGGGGSEDAARGHFCSSSSFENRPLRTLDCVVGEGGLIAGEWCDSLLLMTSMVSVIMSTSHYPGAGITQHSSLGQFNSMLSLGLDGKVPEIGMTGCCSWQWCG